MGESMPRMMPNGPTEAELLCQDIRPKMAKADLPALSLQESRAEYGRILKAARTRLGLGRKETAALLAVDESQLGRWESGDENPQVHKYRRVPALWISLQIAEADDATEQQLEGVEIETTIRIRRQAPWNGVERRRARA